MMMVPPFDESKLKKLFFSDECPTDQIETSPEGESQNFIDSLLLEAQKDAHKLRLLE